MRRNTYSLWMKAVLVLVVALPSVLPASGQSTVQTVYKSKCAMCHAIDGSGDTPAGKKFGARDFRSSEVQNQTDAQLIEISTKGKNKMPGFGKTLSAEQIKQLVAYIRELGKKK